MKKLWYY